MATLSNINNLVIPIDINYIGNVSESDISYKYDTYTFASGEQFILKDCFYDPISMNISKDVFSMMTKPVFHSDVFNNIREEKQGTGSKIVNIDALGQNDFEGFLSLSAIQEAGNLGSSSILAISESDELSANVVDLVRYSLNTTISYSESNLYWYYVNDTLSSTNSPELLTDDYFFYVHFIDGTFCNIKKVNDAGEKFLTYDSGNFIFQSSEDEDFSRFIYSYNPIESRLFLIIKDTGILGFDESGVLSSVPFSSDVSEIENTFSLLPKGSLETEEKIKNSFAPIYDVKNNITKTNELDNHLLITHNYNSNLTNNSNCVILKTNTLYDGSYSLINIDKNVFYKKYTSISTGIRGESGYNNYILSYNTDWYKYSFDGDKQTYFNIPYELKGYTQININECSLIENGAIGGNSPLNSDKIYKKLYEYSDFKNTGKTPSVDNAKYLCSWLWFNPQNPFQSKWLDRYYNPDKVTKLDALSQSGWTTLSSLESFSTKQELSDIYDSYYKEFDKGVGIFDVESKLTIEKDSLYMFEHLGSETSKQILKEKENTLLFDISGVIMNSENSFEIIPDTVDYDEEFSLNVVLDEFDLNKFKGNKIFGNRTISLTVDKDFSPFSIVVDNSIIKYYDFDYNLISVLDLSSTIDDIIFTDDYNKFFVDCGGIIYTVESLDFITNETTTLTSYQDISDIKYYNQKLYILNSSNNSISSYAYDSDVLELESVSVNGSDLLLNIDGTIYTANGDYIDYGDTPDIYVLSSNKIFYNNISSPIISSDNILDYYVDVDDVLFVLKNDGLLKINNKFITKVEKSVDIIPTYGLSSFDIKRYQRNGEIYEYIDIVDKSLTDTKIHRYTKSLEYVDTLTRNISGDFIKPKSRTHTKFLEKQLQFKITLFDIFNYYKRGDVELTLESKYIEENNKNVINIIFSNKYGTITSYCNGRLIDIYKFDNEKYYFSNTLRDNKIFVGSSFLTDESTIDKFVLSSQNDMISTGYTLKNLSLYNDRFDYFDVINYNRIHSENISCHLIIPIKTRSYIEEISGFYIQNKNLRKSEYGAISIEGADLTSNMKEGVKDRVNEIFEDTFINLRINDIKFK